MKTNKNEIADYIINSPSVMYEDGYYYAHWNPSDGLNYAGTTNKENDTVCVACPYECDTVDEFLEKENKDDTDFMEVCGRLADAVNRIIGSEE